MKRCLIAVSLVCVIGLTGCPSSTPTTPAANVPQFTPPVIASEVAQEAGATSKTPEAAVTAFLNALKDGKSNLVAALLSETARNENARQGMEFSPASIPNSSFKVVEAVYPPEDPGVAHVSSMWSDGGEEMQVIWVLRQEPVGWRVAGAAMPLDISQEPVFINFEEPSEIQQIQMARETAAQEAQAAAQAGASATPATDANTPAGTAPAGPPSDLEASNPPAVNANAPPVRTATPPLSPLRK